MNLHSSTVTAAYGGIGGVRSSDIGNPTMEAAIRQLPEQEQREFEAVNAAVWVTERVEIIRLMYWPKFLLPVFSLQPFRSIRVFLKATMRCFRSLSQSLLSAKILSRNVRQYCVCGYELSSWKYQNEKNDIILINYSLSHSLF